MEAKDLIICALLALIVFLILRFIFKCCVYLFCSHYFCTTFKSRGNGMFGFIREYEWMCVKCGKIEYTDSENIEPIGHNFNQNN